MTISAIIQCSTCSHKLRLRYQVGYIEPVIVKIACNQCGKLIKGHIAKNSDTFIFPNDKVFHDYEETDQVISISSELPIAIKSSNTTSFVALTPFMAITDFVNVEKIKEFEMKLQQFLTVYNAKYSQLKTCIEIFQDSNWQYFLIEAKKQFRSSLTISKNDFTESAGVMNDIFKDFYKYISTDFYEVNFNKRLQVETINKVLPNIDELKSLKVSIETYIKIEVEFRKAISLMMRFLDNIKSFFPVIVLTYNNDYNTEYTDELGLTTFEFSDLKDLYIEQFEYLSRISSLYFGLENLAERGNFNDFGTIPDCNVLNDYYAKDNGIKKDIIKKSAILNNYFLNTLNSQIRNGIGHLKTIYEPKKQLIKYFPYKDPARVNTHKEIYLIDFTLQVYQQALKIRDSIEVLAKLLNVTNNG